MGARVEKLFEVKMAEKQAYATQDGSPSFEVNESPKEVNSQSSKRCSTESYCTAPQVKSPRVDAPSLTKHTTDAGEDQPEKNKSDIPTENAGEPSVPTQRKSWRRATITRRSLPAPPNPLQALSRNISTSLPEEERLEKLLEAAMKWALDRTQSSLKTVPKSSPETFQKQVEHIHKEWSGLTKSVYDESHRVPSSSTSETDMKRVMENVQKATNRLNEENQSWEALLSKHRNKAEELNRMVEKGQETGIPLDSAAMAQSSVYHVIQNKPNYHDLLCRQRPMLHAMEMIMDTQCKMVRELLSIKEMSTLLLKEASGRLAEEAGFQTLPTDILKNLMSAPPSTAST
ncbi:kinetochore-associated protein DSN1 homolog [Oryzias melastigma]|uniref:DSN1 component of MIS12 kinetochore complex n=1 Tax=Oryzias melastigma TaxID=30732 RepID=A0A3B3D5P0_ORYME|nr:kinetochore-associated protein DSN1 homolog [Oryzias melastigma]